MEFEAVELQKISRMILQYLVGCEETTSEKVGEAVGLTKRQVDAAITKTLIRHSFVKREARFSDILKKKTMVVYATPRGKRYIDYLFTKYPHLERI